MARLVFKTVSDSLVNGEREVCWRLCRTRTRNHGSVACPSIKSNLRHRVNNREYRAHVGKKIVSEELDCTRFRIGMMSLTRHGVDNG